MYDLNGVLLNEKNNPVNMGTFNYCNPNRAVTALCHLRLDVLPYKKWGNVPNCKVKEHAVPRVSDDVKKYRGTVIEKLKSP